MSNDFDRGAWLSERFDPCAKASPDSPSGEPMLDRLAKALCRSNCHSDAACPTPCGSWQVFRKNARVALETLRDPTPEMLSASQRAIVDTMRRLGWSKTQRNARMSASTKAVMRWSAMIDEALK